MLKEQTSLIEKTSCGVNYINKMEVQLLGLP